MGVKSNSRTPQTPMFALVQRSSTNFKTIYAGHFLSFAHNHHRSLHTLGSGLRTTRLSIPSCPRISPLIRTQSDAFKRPMSTTAFPNATTTQPDHDLETQPAKKQKMNGTPKVCTYFFPSSHSLFISHRSSSKVFSDKLRKLWLFLLVDHRYAQWYLPLRRSSRRLSPPSHGHLP